MNCRNCGTTYTSVTKSQRLGKGIIQRIRACDNCLISFYTFEKAGCPKCRSIGQVTQTMKIGGIVKRWRKCPKCDMGKYIYTTHEEVMNKRPIISTTTSTSSSSSTTSTTTDQSQTTKDFWKDLEQKNTGEKPNGNEKTDSKPAKKRGKPPKKRQEPDI